MTRGEAINWIINLTADIGKMEHQDLWHYEQALEEIRDMIEAMPLEQPERIRGKWLELDISDAQVGEWQSMKCSVCGRYHTTPYMYYPTWYAYCPHCGAEMGERDGSEG